jgi:hypothetical protein
MARIETIRVSERQFIREPDELATRIATLLTRAREATAAPPRSS